MTYFFLALICAAALVLRTLRHTIGATPGGALAREAQKERA